MSSENSKDAPAHPSSQSTDTEDAPSLTSRSLVPGHALPSRVRSDPSEPIASEPRTSIEEDEHESTHDGRRQIGHDHEPLRPDITSRRSPEDETDHAATVQDDDSTKRARSNTPDNTSTAPETSHRDKRPRVEPPSTPVRPSRPHIEPKTPRPHHRPLASRSPHVSTTKPKRTTSLPNPPTKTSSTSTAPSPNSFSTPTNTARHPYADFPAIDLSAPSPRKKDVTTDPANRFITHQRLNLKPWESIVSTLNEHEVANGRPPRWTQAGVYGRFKRNGSAVAEAHGCPPFDTSVYMHLRSEGGAPALRLLSSPASARGEVWEVSVDEGRDAAVVEARDGKAEGKGAGTSLKVVLEKLVASEDFNNAVEAAMKEAEAADEE